MKKYVFSSKAMQKDFGLLLLRLASGAMMLSHGWPKLSQFAERAETFRDPIGLGSELSLSLAIFAEVFCALLVMAGLATRLALLPLMFTMFVAVFIVHAEDPWARQELGLLYLMVYAALFFTGPGKYSLDEKIGR
jgi:putative oxidoreductase